MRPIKISEIKPDQKLGKSILDDKGRILLRYGTTVTASFIQRLKDMGFTYVYIEDKVSEGIEIEEVVSEEVTNETKRVTRDMADRFLAKGEADFTGVIKSSSMIIDDILENKDVMMSVSSMRSSGEFLFAHSVSVCSLATITALKLGYNVSKLKDIAVGALLHDIGKIQVLKEHKLKPEDFYKLDESVKKTHAKAGYDLLGENIQIGPTSKVMALLHHEHCDGSGYPMGLTKDKVHESARILAICDAFDNMVTGRSELGDIPVYQAVEYLVNTSYRYDEDIVKIFVQNIAVFPNGTGVELNDKSKGIVVRQNKGMPTRPVVKIIVDSDGNVPEQFREIDLLEALSTFVNRTIDIGGYAL